MGHRYTDLTGKRFGRLVVLKHVGTNKFNCSVWKCQCDCGNVKDISSNSLRNGDSTSCGCAHKSPKIDITGIKYGRLKVIEYAGRGKWVCECECGTRKEVRGARLKSGDTKSCGCRYKEYIHSPKWLTHGDTGTKLYERWHSMLRRCNEKTNKSYHAYGGRGIRVCKEWHDYSAFREWSMNSGYKQGLELDRIDVNGNYEPSNCRWVTTKQNARNRRNTKYLTYKGETLPIAEWSDRVGIPYTALFSRVKDGWSAEEALTTPLYEKRQQKSPH